MHQKISFEENHISQLPALELFIKLGYTYLSQKEIEQERRGKNTNVLLEDILESQLRKLNSIHYRGEEYSFSNNNIQNAIKALKNFPLKDGLISTSEKVFDLITLGKSFEENIKGDSKSFTLEYIDWDHPENNVFHVAAEFEVQRTGTIQTYRPDIVLFVNGIPFSVIEAKRPDLTTSDNKSPLEQAISQHLRNQQSDGIMDLYIYTQVLGSICSNDAQYATTGTEKEYWFYWKEQKPEDDKINTIVNTTLEKAQRDKLFSGKFAYLKSYFEKKEENPVSVTPQDRLLYYVFSPSRLIELTNKFIVYDEGIKKVARYQQYFAVQNTLLRVRNLEGGQRQGGVIWHTQGSGKSLTMVMLAKSLAMEPNIQNPQIVLVTDRVDLDDQIYGTFKNCDKEVIKAKTGKHLGKLINTKTDKIITTVIDKFEAALKKGEVIDESPNIFVLVDESHRSQYGESHVRMRKVFPNACYIGFTGTPLMRKDKNTAAKFGGFIDKYTIDQAVKDKAVVPLLYEGREVVQNVNQNPIDTYFDMISEPLSEYQRGDLKKKFSRSDQLNEAEQKIHRIAWDVSLHFKTEWQNTGFKGQLTAPNKKRAVKYKQFFDEIGLISTELLISGPDTREGYETFYEEPSDEVLKFWKQMITRYGSEKQYNEQVINAFKKSDKPEVIIVVDKLLTGFDAPRNVVLYITRSLKEHSLLQAIARVNRVFEGKDFGFIIDYYGILGELDQALTMYSELSGFDEEDLEGTLISVREEIKKLPEKYSQLWDIFKTIKNKYDEEAYEQLLADQKIREDFYDRLSSFNRTFKVALSTLEFVENTPEKTIEKYKNDAKFFQRLRISVKRRYSDEIDYKQYEKQIQKLIDTHITSDEVIQLTDQVNIFEKEKFSKEVERIEGKAAKADTIASRTKKTINENMDDDPVFYKKFSKLLQEAIDDWRQRRISDAEYLERVTSVMNSVQKGTTDNVPDNLKNKEVAQAFYRSAEESLKDKVPKGKKQDIAAEIGLNIDEIINKHKIVDWQRMDDIKNKMSQDIEDFLFKMKEQHNLDIGWDEIDDIIEKSLSIAERRY
ncbi:MAG: type I restriction endonuclease subunit R [Bacteroidales bacterium]